MRAIFSFVVAALIGWSQPALAECFGTGATTVCTDASGNTRTITQTGDGTVLMDQSGNVTSVTNFPSGSIRTYQDGNVVTTTDLKDGSVSVGSDGDGKAWSQTNLDIGGGNVLRSVTSPDGKTQTTTCGPGLPCR